MPYTTLPDDAYGLDVNPLADRIRLVAGSGTNLRVDPSNALVITDAPINPIGPTVVGSAYTNNFAGTLTTTLYDIDVSSDVLAVQNPPNNGTVVQVGPLGVNATAANFDIVTTDVDRGYAALVVGGVTGLYSLNLATGAASLVGSLGGNPQLVALSVVRPDDVFADSFE